MLQGSLPMGANGTSVQQQRASRISANTEVSVRRIPGQQSAFGRAVGVGQVAAGVSQVVGVGQVVAGIGRAVGVGQAFGVGQAVGAIEQPQQQVARHGIMDAFVNTSQRWKLSEKEKLLLLGYNDNPFLGNQILESRILATPQDVRDRAAYLLAISVGLGAMFNEVADAELKWLKLPNSKLNGKTPLAFMLEGRMVNIITVLQLVEQERGL
jgi:Protein of unknown function (DUF2384)